MTPEQAKRLKEIEKKEGVMAVEGVENPDIFWLLSLVKEQEEEIKEYKMGYEYWQREWAESEDNRKSLRKLLEKAKEDVEELAHAGISFKDPRIKYIEIQVDKESCQHAKQTLSEIEEALGGKEK